MVPEAIAVPSAVTLPSALLKLTVTLEESFAAVREKFVSFRVAVEEDHRAPPVAVMVMVTASPAASTTRVPAFARGKKKDS